MSKLLTEKERKEYILKFAEQLTDVVEKKIFNKRAMGIKFSIKKEASPKHINGQRRIITLTEDDKMLKFAIDLVPWRWENGSVEISFMLLETKNLVVPRRKIDELPPKVALWEPGKSDYWFLQALEPVMRYQKILSLDVADVGLLQNLEMILKNLVD